MRELRSYEEYEAVGSDVVRRTCLHVATVLGDLMRTDLTVVGGLVPSLLVPQSALPLGAEAHCGTIDVDLGLSLTILDEQVYADVARRLRDAGFAADKAGEGRRARQRWRTPSALPGCTIDFLIPPASPRQEGGRLQSLERDFAAIIVPGLQLVARDWRMVTLAGRALLHEETEREVRVCGPGAFTVLKARAFRQRGRDKDAYDLVYVLQHYGRLQDTAAALRPLLHDAHAQEAVQWLAEDFATLDSIGPVRCAVFRYGARDDNLQADALGLVQGLLRLVV